MASTQAIQITDLPTLTLKPGVVLQVLGDGTVSVVDPSTGNIDVVGALPKSTMVSSVDASNANSAQAPRSSFRIFPGFPNPIRGTADRLHGTLNTLSGCLSDAVAAAPCTPTGLVGGGMSVVKGLSAVCGQWTEASSEPEPEGDSQPAGIANGQGIFSGGLSALNGIRSFKTSIFSDTLKIASLIQDIVLLPLRFAAALRPLGSKANIAIDMITSEDAGLTQIVAQIHEEIFTKNINNITKLALVAAAGAAGLMGVCFLVAAVALVVGLGMIPVIWSLVTLLMFGLYKSRRMPRPPLRQCVQPQMPPKPPTPVLPLPQRSSRSYFL